MDLPEHPEAWHDLVDPGRDKSKGRPSLDVLRTVTSKEERAKTRLTIVSTFETPVLRDAMVGIGMEPGWNHSLDELLART